MTDNQFNMVKTKYPFLLEGSCVSLYKIGEFILMTKSLGNDKQSLKILGLENFLTDVKYMFGDIKTERKEKLKRLNKPH